MFTSGYKSTNFHFISFTDKAAQNTISERIKNGLKACEQSVFVLDEVDKLPHKGLDVILPFINRHADSREFNPKRAIFFLVSDIAAKAINETVMKHDHWEDIDVEEIQNIISDIVFKDKGGLVQSEIVERKLIDYYIPFMSLTQEHVKKCIRQEAENKGIYLSPKQILDIARHMKYNKFGDKSFSTYGCGSVGSIIGRLGRKKSEYLHNEF